MGNLFNPDVRVFIISIFRLCLWLTILVVLFAPIEYLFAAHSKKFWRKGMVIDLYYYFLNNIISASLLSVPIGLLAWAVRYVIPEGLVALTTGLPLWSRLMVGLVAGDLGYYWGHRCCHEFPALWGFHSIHHSAEELDFLTNSRAHPVDLVFGRFCSLVPIYILGLGGPTGSGGSAVPVAITLIGAIWGFFIHANVRWRFGALEGLISTPAFHHWHHTRKAPYNRNYSATLPWIDRIFGTYHLPKEFPNAYGINATVPQTLVGQLLYPLDAEQLPKVSEKSLD